MTLRQTTFDYPDNASLQSGMAAPASGDHFQLLGVISSGDSRIVHTDPSAPGGHCVTVFSPNVANGNVFGWDGVFSAANQQPLTIRGYVRLHADTTADGASLAQSRTAGSFGNSIRQDTGRRISGSSKSSGLIAPFVATLETWYMLEQKHFPGTTTTDGRVIHRIWDVTGATLLASSDLGSTSAGAAALTSFRMGKTGAVGTVNADFAAFAISDTMAADEWFGPLSSGSAGAVDVPAMNATATAPIPEVSGDTVVTGGGAFGVTAQIPVPSVTGIVAQTNPFVSLPLYVSPNNSAVQAMNAETNPHRKSMLDRIAKEAVPRYYGEWIEDPQADVASWTTAAATANRLPLVVLYAIVNRDEGPEGFSSGGVANAAAYRTYVDALAAGIGTRKCVVIVEPDALPQMDNLTAAQRTERYDLLKYAVGKLTALPACTVYLDAGNSGEDGNGWIPAAEMGSRLTQANVSMTRGFSVNVANFKTTAATVAYAEQISNNCGGKFYVVDTSRNGLGPKTDGTILERTINPEGRALGARPLTPYTGGGAPRFDAQLWLKIVGESDGNRDGAPPAGTFYPDYAIGLAERAPWANVAMSLGTSSSFSITGGRPLLPRITRDLATGRLLKGGVRWRATGTNIFQLVVNDYPNVRTMTNAEIDSLLDKAVSMKHGWVRALTLGQSIGPETGMLVKGISGTGANPTIAYDAAAWERIDYAVAAAASRGLYLMVTLTGEPGSYHGAKRNWVNFRFPGSCSMDTNVNSANNGTQRTAENKFYSDAQIVLDFDKFSSDYMDHTNQYTGRKNRDEPAIFAIQSGNEMWTADDFRSWQPNWAAKMKTHSPNTLIADGMSADLSSYWASVGQDPIEHIVTPESLASPNIDMHGFHPYTVGTVSDLNEINARCMAAKKAGMFDEYGWSKSTATALEDAAVTSSNIFGFAYWSLQNDADLHNYSNGNPPAYGGDDSPLYYPGKDSTQTAEVARQQQLAIAMSGASGAMSLSSASALSVAGVSNQRGAVALTTASALSSQGTPRASSSLALNTSGSLTSTGVSAPSASMSLSTVGVWSGSGSLRSAAALSLSGASALSGSGAVVAVPVSGALSLGTVSALSLIASTTPLIRFVSSGGRDINTSTSKTINRSITGVQDGDVLYLHSTIGQGTDFSLDVAQAGWTLLTTQTASGFGLAKLWRRVWRTGDPITYGVVFTRPTTSTVYWNSSITVVAGADTTTPEDSVLGQAKTGAANTPITLNLGGDVGSSLGALLLGFVAGLGEGTGTWSGVDGTNIAEVSKSSTYVRTFWKIQPTNGPGSLQIQNTNGQAAGGAQITVAVRPALAGSNASGTLALGTAGALSAGGSGGGAGTLALGTAGSLASAATPSFNRTLALGTVGVLAGSGGPVASGALALGTSGSLVSSSSPRSTGSLPLNTSSTLGLSSMGSGTGTVTIGTSGHFSTSGGPSFFASLSTVSASVLSMAFGPTGMKGSTELTTQSVFSSVGIIGTEGALELFTESAMMLHGLGKPEGALNLTTKWTGDYGTDSFLGIGTVSLISKSTLSTGGRKIAFSTGFFWSVWDGTELIRLNLLGVWDGKQIAQVTAALAE